MKDWQRYARLDMILGGAVSINWQGEEEINLKSFKHELVGMIDGSSCLGN